jgi:hypothetical protein
MSARLTLLFLCDRSESDSLFISALIASEFQVLLAHDINYAKVLLANFCVDAIMISHMGSQGDVPVGASLKLVAPHTPLILCNNGSNAASSHAGVDSVCSADLKDDSVARAVALFFRQSIVGSRLRRVQSALEEGVSVMSLFPNQRMTA